jgi:hypothetical protein
VEENALLKEFERTPHTSRCSTFFPWMSGATYQAKSYRLSKAGVWLTVLDAGA